MARAKDGGIPATWAETAESGTYEAALETLDAIVTFLEDGRRPLDEMVAAYEVGVRISQRCEELLASAELRVSRITVDHTPRGIDWTDRPDDDADDDDAGADGDTGTGPDEAPF